MCGEGDSGCARCNPKLAQYPLVTGSKGCDHSCYTDVSLMAHPPNPPLSHICCVSYSQPCFQNLAACFPTPPLHLPPVTCFDYSYDPQTVFPPLALGHLTPHNSSQAGSELINTEVQKLSPLLKTNSTKCVMAHKTLCDWGLCPSTKATFLLGSIGAFL